MNNRSIPHRVWGLLIYIILAFPMTSFAESVLVFRPSVFREGYLPHTIVLPDCRTISSMAVQFACLHTSDSLAVYSLDTGKCDDYDLSILANYPSAYETISLYLENVPFVYFDISTGSPTPIDLASGASCLDWSNTGGGSTQDKCPGDFNGDNVVDGFDFLMFRNEWGNTGCNEPTTECLCDMNGDGVVDGLDFLIFRNNWGNTCP